MNGNKFLLDTNIIIGLFANDSQIVKQLQKDTHTFIPVIALGELYYGAEQSKHKEANLKQIEKFSESSSTLECNEETAKFYAQIKSKLKLQGTPIPENDIWIAALAFQYELTLVTRDNHFKHIKSLKSVTW
jgi:tRNA(fMet)-specific endonuclease VapC